MHNHTGRQTASVKSLNERHVAVCRFEGAGKESHYLKVIQQFTANWWSLLEMALLTVHSLQIPSNFFSWRVIRTLIHVTQKKANCLKKGRTILRPVWSGRRTAEGETFNWEVRSLVQNGTVNRELSPAYQSCWVIRVCESEVDCRAISCSASGSRPAIGEVKIHFNGALHRLERSTTGINLIGLRVFADAKKSWTYVFSRPTHFSGRVFREVRCSFTSWEGKWWNSEQGRSSYKPSGPTLFPYNPFDSTRNSQRLSAVAWRSCSCLTVTSCSLPR